MAACSSPPTSRQALSSPAPLERNSVSTSARHGRHLPAILMLWVTTVAWPAAQAPPGDGEIQVIRDRATEDTVTTLTLILRGPKGPLPVSLVLTTTRKRSTKPGSLDELGMR